MSVKWCFLTLEEKETELGKNCRDVVVREVVI